MSAADFYTGIVADVYAALRSTTFDSGRYLEFVRNAGQPALELGCGEDGPFLELLRRGIDIDGVDSSQDMLDRCRAQADIEGLPIATYCQSMQDLQLPRSYRAIYLAGPTFNLLPDDDTARRTLRGIADHLEPGGQAMVPLWIPPATDQQDFGRTREAAVAGGMTARYTIESEDYDETGRTRCTHTLYELAGGGYTEAVRRDWIIHWHTPSGFVELAQDAGLTVTHLTSVENREFTVHLQRGSKASRSPRCGQPVMNEGEY